jgi:FlaA1/EpsC-like NDP-sugar epimerase
LIVATDVALLSIGYLGAYMLRFEADLSALEWTAFIKTLPLVLIIKIGVFFKCDMYKGMWRYTSLTDLINVVKASVISSVLVVLAVLFIFHFQGFSRSVFIIDWILTVCLVGGVRASIRLLLANNISTFWSFHPGDMEKPKKLLIVGAGSAGEKVLREMHDNPRLRMQPAGLIDDDPHKQGKSIHGVPVLGTTNDLPGISRHCDEILIAIPSLNSAGMRKIVSACEKTGKKFRTMPSLGELIGGMVSVNAVREVTIEDLVGRGEVRLEQDRIGIMLNRKRILVTGAGGSIGSELVRHICRFNPQSVTLLDFSEYNLFQIDLECRRRFDFVSFSSILADIRDKGAVRSVFHRVKPHVVFHAAAYKHVPIQELHPWEAVYNNVLGTRNVVEAALEAEAERFVLVSTDKAVRPSNVMGATKRIAEMLVESTNGHNTRFMAVRFGNVLGSSGSAVPVFQEQISRGGPVTVTHPDVTRYFMSISEAVQLILQASSMGEGGETFILDMGEPVRILDLVEDLIRLHGLEPHKDIPIQFIGMRPGEKLTEELITDGEGIVSTAHEKIMVVRGDSHNYDQLISNIDDLLIAAQTFDAHLIKEKIRELVPEYVPEADQPV